MEFRREAGETGAMTAVPLSRATLVPRPAPVRPGELRALEGALARVAAGAALVVRSGDPTEDPDGWHKRGPLIALSVTHTPDGPGRRGAGPVAQGGGPPDRCRVRPGRHGRGRTVRRIADEAIGGDEGSHFFPRRTSTAISSGNSAHRGCWRRSGTSATPARPRSRPPRSRRARALPGDPEGRGRPRFDRLHTALDALLAPRRPFVAVGLGLRLGFPAFRRAVPDQGVQKEIDQLRAAGSPSGRTRWICGARTRSPGR